MASKDVLGPLPPLNEDEKRDKEYGSQNMRLFYSLWKRTKNRRITGPANEDTRQRALVELVKIRRKIGGPDMMVNSYISVAPNYYIYPCRHDDCIVYELGFDLFFVVPVGCRERMYESMYREKVAGFTRMIRYTEQDVPVKELPNGMVNIPLGRISYVDLDLKQGLGRIRAGKVKDYNCFDIQFSLDFSVQRGLDLAKHLIEDRFIDDMSEEEIVDEW